jgi:plastocyanin
VSTLFRQTVRAIFAIAFALALAACGGPPPPERRLEVIVTAAGYEPTRLEAQAGEIVFIRFVNNDRVAHSFAVDLPSGQRSVAATDGVDAILTITVPEPGEFRYFCLVPGHTEEGVLVVKP